MSKRTYSQYISNSFSGKHDVAGIECESFNIVVEVIEVRNMEDMVYTANNRCTIFQKIELRCLVRKYSFYNPFFTRGVSFQERFGVDHVYKLSSGLHAIAQCRKYLPYDTSDNKEYEEVKIKMRIRKEPGDRTFEISNGYWELQTYDLQFADGYFSMQCHGMTRVENYRMNWRKVSVGVRRPFVVRDETMGKILANASMASSQKNDIEIERWQTHNFGGVDSRHIVCVPPHGQEMQETFYEMSPFETTLRTFFKCAAAVKFEPVIQRGMVWDFIPINHATNTLISKDVAKVFEVSIFEKLAAQWKVSTKFECPQDVKEMRGNVIREGSLFEKVRRAYSKNKNNKSHTINVLPEDMPDFFGMRSLVEVKKPMVYGMGWETIESERTADISGMLDWPTLSSIKSRLCISMEQMKKIPYGLLTPSCFVKVDGQMFSPCNQKIVYLEPKDAEMFRQKGVIEISAKNAELLSTNKLEKNTCFNFDGSPYFLRPFCKEGQIYEVVRKSYQNFFDAMLARSDQNKLSRIELIPDGDALPSDLEPVNVEDLYV